MKTIILWLMRFVSTSDKVSIASILLDDVLKDKQVSISDVEAEMLIGKIVRSSGNKVVDFIIKD